MFCLLSLQVQNQSLLFVCVSGHIPEMTLVKGAGPGLSGSALSTLKSLGRNAKGRSLVSHQCLYPFFHRTHKSIHWQ